MSSAQTAPADGVWRRSAKVLVVDPAGRILLVRMRDPSDPAVGEWWELPGGGLEPGESAQQAAARELVEETGLVVPLSAVGPAVWTRRATFRWLRRRRWQEETVHVVRLSEPAARVPLTLTDEEQGSLLDVEWRDLATLAAIRTYPGRLAELAPRVLAGETVDEGFERWD